MATNYWEAPPAPLPTSLNEPELQDLPTEIPLAMPGPYHHRASHIPDRVVKRQIKSRGAQSRKRIQTNPVGKNENYMGEEVPPTLKSSCPEEERCIFASRWQHRHKTDQDMWDNIQNDFQDRFQYSYDRTVLQMMLGRAQSKYIDWLPQDETLLREAWTAVERSRYQLILKAFLELGGSKNMRLCASDIQAKITDDLNLENDLFIETLGSASKRRRQKSRAGR
jgi:hypothetical protein